MNDRISMSDEAALIVAHDEGLRGGPVVPPIVQTSLFTFATYEEMAETFAARRVRPIYSRGLNPTVRLFEEKIARLEKAEDALGFASGMAAISSTVLAFVRPGDRVICVEHVYPDAYRFFEMMLRGLGVHVDYVDGRDLEAVERALPGARLIYLESPTSWTFHVHDLGAIATLARRHGVITVADNSCATPIFQNPITLGCDLVVHSASKYIGGHSDTVAGVVAGSAELVGRIRGEVAPYLGGKLSPFEAWLLVRGLRTLPARMREIERSGLAIARRLAAHPRVDAVHHPSLADAPLHGMLGTSGLFAFSFAPGVDIPAFCNALRLFSLGVSWGGHESLAIPASISLLQVGGPNSAIAFNVSERIVRLNIGLECPDALWSDLERAIDAACKPKQGERT